MTDSEFLDLKKGDLLIAIYSSNAYLVKSDHQKPSKGKSKGKSILVIGDAFNNYEVSVMASLRKATEYEVKSHKEAVQRYLDLIG